MLFAGSGIRKDRKDMNPMSRLSKVSCLFFSQILIHLHALYYHFENTPMQYTEIFFSCKN